MPAFWGLNHQNNNQLFGENVESLPIRASLTPRSAPLGPFPRKGNITPGESYEYTNGFSDSFVRVEITRVCPGLDDVRNAFGVPIILRNR